MSDAVSADAVSADAVSADDSTGKTRFQYSAVIIEPRHHAALAFVLSNIVTYLPTTWQIIVLHGLLNRKFVTDIITDIVASAPEHADRFTRHALPCNNLTIPGYNLLLGSRALYELIPTETFIVFQTDTMIFAEHAGLLDEFLEFDYVGAPWRCGGVGNGGFSLRRKSVSLKALASFIFNTHAHEDGFFTTHSPNRPSGDKARQFSIESVFSEVAFACHKPWGHLSPELVFDTYPAARELSELQRLVDPPQGSVADYAELLDATTSAATSASLDTLNSISISMCARLCGSAACLSPAAAPALALGLLQSANGECLLTIPAGCPIPPGVGDKIVIREASSTGTTPEHELVVLMNGDEIDLLDKMKPTKYLMLFFTEMQFRPILDRAIKMQPTWIIVQCAHPTGPILLERH